MVGQGTHKAELSAAIGFRKQREPSWAVSGICLKGHATLSPQRDFTFLAGRRVRVKIRDIWGKIALFFFFSILYCNLAYMPQSRISSFSLVIRSLAFHRIRNLTFLNPTICWAVCFTCSISRYLASNHLVK